MEYLLLLGLIMLGMNESDTPKWSEELIPCEQTEVVDVVTAIEKTYYAKKYLCKEGPEVCLLYTSPSPRD